MRSGLAFVFCILFLGPSIELSAQSLVVVDSIDKIDECLSLAKEIKTTTDTINKKDELKILEYKKIDSNLNAAQEKFYRLEIEESERMIDQIILDFSNSIVSGGSPDDIYRIFKRMISHKMLILLAKKEEKKAIDLLRDYIFVFNPIPDDGKNIHPVLKKFLISNLESIKGIVIADKETATIIKRSFSTGKDFIFDGNSVVEDTVLKGKHILIIEYEADLFRVVVSNFDMELFTPLFVGSYKGGDVYIVMTEEGFQKMVDMNKGREMVFCRYNGTGVISQDGKIFSRDEILSRGIKVEIVSQKEVDKNEGGYKKWWIFAVGGTIAAVIISSIFLINPDSGKKENFKDIIQVK